jgi:hypothetical protein
VTKADDERDVFREFAVVAGLDVDPDSIESQDPPLPDISCRIAGQIRYFELTRAANQDIANDVGGLLVKGRKTGEGGVGKAHVYGDRETLTAAVKRKATTTHETHGAPLDLLVYYDGWLVPIPEREVVEPVLKSLRAQYSGRWRTIWLYDRVNKWVLP